MSSAEHETTTEKTDEQWREQLDPMAYRVLREAATEAPWTGALVDQKGDGIYRCGGCGAELFSSKTKYESGSGWPSFTDPTLSDAVVLREDRSHFMTRTEALCARCGGHLGHVFDDGPGDSGQRYCINSAALEFDAGQ